MSKAMVRNPGSLAIRFTSRDGNVNVVMNSLKTFINGGWIHRTGANFEVDHAEIHMDLANFKNDPREDDFYPLRIHCRDKYGDVILMCSEFRTGYHGDSVNKLITCLLDLGFKLSHTDVEKIYNDTKLDLVIYKS